MLARTLLVAALLGSTAAMPATPAVAADCVAEADLPRSGVTITAVGRFRCAGPRSGMTVTVCLDHLGNGPRSPWLSDGCVTTTAGSPTSVVAAAKTGCPHALLYRTTAWGSNADGSFAYAESVVAVPAFCLSG